MLNAKRASLLFGAVLLSLVRYDNLRLAVQRILRGRRRGRGGPQRKFFV